MKKIIGVIVALCVMMGFAACGSGPKSNSSVASKPERKIGGNVPQFVKDAAKNAPEDALVGIGTARAQSLGLARTTAATRARAEISRQMNTMIQDMVRDYSGGSELDSAALSFQENFTIALSKSTLTGSTIVQEDTDENGNYWVVVMLSKDNRVKEIISAQEAAKKLSPAAMASFNAEERMNKAFDKAYGTELGYSDSDKK